MLKICDNFAAEFTMKFNPLKSKYLLYCKRKSKYVPNIVWNGQHNRASSSDVHLGNIIGTRANQFSIDKAIGDFYLRFNYFSYIFTALIFLRSTNCSKHFACRSTAHNSGTSLLHRPTVSVFMLHGERPYDGCSS